MSFLIFETLETAELACQQIDTNMGFPDGNGTERWALPTKAHQQELWYVPKPPEYAMTNVISFEERENIDDLRKPNILQRWHAVKKK